MVVRDQPQDWSLELTRFHGSNVVRYEVVTNGKRTPTVGTYLPTSTLEHLPNLEESLTRFRYQDFIVLGDLSADIGQSQNPRRQQVDDLLM